MAVKGSNGSELHRVKEFKNLDNERFERMYKTCKPLINRLSKNIDSRRYNLTPDIIRSYFTDKFMYVYGRYADIYEDEQLKANLLRALATYKNKLLRSAYNRQAEYNQSLTSLEELFDDSKELIDDNDEYILRESNYEKFHQYLRDNLTPDEYLLYKTQIDPPAFFEQRMKESHGKLSILHLIDYFELPRDRKAQNLLTGMRNKIKQTLERAKTDLR